MHRAWIPMTCPECSEHWESDPADLPAPGTAFGCRHCDAERPIAEFVRTTRGLDILRDVHGEQA